LEVLEAAETKWNFLPFRPGLVGGHCIGVDPYYLTHKAVEAGYHPEVILAGRRINDRMGEYVAEQVIKLMTRNRIHVVDAHVLVLGLTFKENCPDLRNSKVIDTINALKAYNVRVDVFDPWIDVVDAEREYGITPLADLPRAAVYDAVILAVPHHQFTGMGVEAIRRLAKPSAILYDVKSVLPAGVADGRL
jgi:UDP-N-acetyl-D-galactosamine dehydrogenase